MSMSQSLTRTTGRTVASIRGACVIGRSLDCDIRVDDARVSRHHARVIARDGQLILQDLSSANGTFVNGRRVRGELALSDRDEIVVGSARLRVETNRDDSVTNPPVRLSAAPSVTVAAATFGVNTQRVRLDPSDEIARLHRKLAVMYQFGDLIAQALEPLGLLQRVIERILEVYPQAADAAVVPLEPRDTDTASELAYRRRDSDRVRRVMPIPNEIVQRVVAQGHAVLLRNADRPSRAPLESPRITLATTMPTGFCMAAPIIFRDEAFGILHVDADPDADAFDQADLDLLSGIATQTAVALRLARLLEQQRVQERVEKDLSIARQIQRNLLPRRPPAIEGLEFAVHYEPAFRVGGDFYDFVWLDETHLGLVIGDVSGKAVSGALFMARVASEIRAHAALEREPRRILRRVHRAIEDASDDGVFCTALVMSIDIERNVARFANAAHVLPLLCRDGKWSAIEDEGARSTPLGVAPDCEAGEVEFALRPGDRLLLYTDGLIEAALEGGALYGEQRLREALDRAGPDARAAIDAVLDDVDRFVGGTPQRDDETLVCVQVMGTFSRRVDSVFPPRASEVTPDD